MWPDLFLDGMELSIHNVEPVLRTIIDLGGMAPMVPEMGGAPYQSLMLTGYYFKATMLLLCPAAQQRTAWAADEFVPPPCAEFTRTGACFNDLYYGQDSVAPNWVVVTVGSLLEPRKGKNQVHNDRSYRHQRRATTQCHEA